MKEQMETMAFKVPVRILKEIRRHKEKTGVSMSYTIRQALEIYVKKIREDENVT